MSSLRYISSICFILFLTSCQVYRNNGRNLFEAAAPTPTNNIGSSTFPVMTPECWSQPASEALWFAKSGKEYHVHYVEDQSNTQTIEVCFEESAPASSINND